MTESSNKDARLVGARPNFVHSFIYGMYAKLNPAKGQGVMSFIWRTASLYTHHTATCCI